ncbi:MAG TPA: hypothetical protein VHD81_06125 [Mycobacteriales bacterium]|nr:hypothetical protein [Mycobacteriales bacterium]
MFKELGIWVLSLDRAGYGSSDPAHGSSHLADPEKMIGFYKKLSASN